MSQILAVMKTFLCTLSQSTVSLTFLAAVFPGTVYMLWKTIELKKDCFTKYVVCKMCFTLYRFEDCCTTVEGEMISKKCTNVLFPKSCPERKTVAMW